MIGKIRIKKRRQRRKRHLRNGLRRSHAEPLRISHLFLCHRSRKHHGKCRPHRQNGRAGQNRDKEEKRRAHDLITAEAYQGIDLHTQKQKDKGKQKNLDRAYSKGYRRFPGNSQIGQSSRRFFIGIYDGAPQILKIFARRTALFRLAVSSSLGLAIRISLTVGSSLGLTVRISLTVGSSLGLAVRISLTVGSSLGLAVRISLTVGSSLGLAVRISLTVGSSLGLAVRISLTVGSSLGLTVRISLTVGSSLGLAVEIPLAVGSSLGLAVGSSPGLILSRLFSSILSSLLSGLRRRALLFRHRLTLCRLLRIFFFLTLTCTDFTVLQRPSALTAKLCHIDSSFMLSLREQEFL